MCIRPKKLLLTPDIPGMCLLWALGFPLLFRCLYSEPERIDYYPCASDGPGCWFPPVSLWGLCHNTGLSDLMVHLILYAKRTEAAQGVTAGERRIFQVRCEQNVPTKALNIPTYYICLAEEKCFLSIAPEYLLNKR